MYIFPKKAFFRVDSRTSCRHLAELSFRAAVPALLVAALLSSPTRAAFLIEAHESGIGNDNFEFGEGITAVRESLASRAVGLTATNSVFGAEGATDEPHTYWFEYTPGRDDDNVTFAPGQVLGSQTGAPGNGNRATGLVGGNSGRYKVYITSPQSANVNGGPSTLTLEHEGEPVVVEVDLNNGETGPDTELGVGFVGGANNAWYLLGAVNYFANQSYEISMQASLNTFVSQRVHGIMWEYAPLEPGDFNEDTLLDTNDIDLLTAAILEQTIDPAFDLNADSLIDFRDREVWVDEIKATYFGDANLDGEFNSSDFVSVFVAGEYEDDVPGNSVWATGDWNGDTEFNSTDFVSAFRSGGFEQGPRAAVPEPSSLLLAAVALAAVPSALRRRR